MNAATNSLGSGERIAVVDVLRAFALFGIIVTHAVDGFPNRVGGAAAPVADAA